MAKIGLAAVRLGLDFFLGDLPTCAGLSPQQFVAVGVLVALSVIGVRSAGHRPSGRSISPYWFDGKDDAV